VGIVLEINIEFSILSSIVPREIESERANAVVTKDTNWFVAKYVPTEKTIEPMKLHDVVWVL
jgi:hypothetical protein